MPRLFSLGLSFNHSLLIRAFGIGFAQSVKLAQQDCENTINNQVRDSITCDASACDAGGCVPEWSFKMGGNDDCHDAGDGFTYCFCHAYNVSYACTLCSQEPDLEDEPKNPKGLRYNTKKK